MDMHRFPVFGCINGCIYTCRNASPHFTGRTYINTAHILPYKVLPRHSLLIWINYPISPSVRHCFPFSIMQRLFVSAVSCAHLFTIHVHSCQGNWMRAFSTVWASFEIQILSHSLLSLNNIDFHLLPRGTGIYLGLFFFSSSSYSTCASGAFLDCSQMLQAQV